MDKYDKMVSGGEVSSAAGIGSHARHLYVMQAASGRIKIGRSSDPRARRKDIQAGIGQPLFLLKVFKNRGSEEKAIHAKLMEWHEFGEWFSNTGHSRMAIGRALGASIGFRVFEKLPMSEAIAKALARLEVDAALEALAVETAIGRHGRRNRITESREEVRARWYMTDEVL